MLVLVHTIDLDVLLLERADHPGYWQSVTGSLEEEESREDAAKRELLEETGLENGILEDWEIETEYEIYPEWRYRYAPGVSKNVEHVFGFTVDKRCEVRLSAREHLNFMWLPYQEAATRVFSPSNASAIRKLPEMMRK